MSSHLRRSMAVCIAIASVCSIAGSTAWADPIEPYVPTDSATKAWTVAEQGYSARLLTQEELAQFEVEPAGPEPRDPTGDLYNWRNRLFSATGFAELHTNPAGNNVTFGVPNPQALTPYVNAVPGVLFGQTTNVAETSTNLGGGLFRYEFTNLLVSAGSGAADLFPGGLAINGAPANIAAAVVGVGDPVSNPNPMNVIRANFRFLNAGGTLIFETGNDFLPAVNNPWDGIHAAGITNLPGALTTRVELIMIVGETTGAPTGACCFTDGSCVIAEEAHCENAAAGGTYVGDFTACINDECPAGNGACCMSDGTCDDLDVTACTGAGGEFLGAGTTCATAECPEVCPPNSSGQPASTEGQGAGGVVGSVSDSNPLVNQEAFDNFTPAVGGNVNSITWWGFYAPLPLGSGACTPQGGDAADNFTVTYFNNDEDTPGDVIAGPFPVTPTKTDTGKQIVGLLNLFQYTASHPNVPLQAGQCTWVRVLNNTTADCVWLWGVAEPGDLLSHVNNDGVEIVTDVDRAFCVNLDMNTDGCESAIAFGACCNGEVCTITSELNCNGLFAGPNTECTPNPCILGACCLFDGGCVEATLVDCQNIFQGHFLGGFCPGNPADLCPTPFTCDAPAVACNGSITRDNTAIGLSQAPIDQPDMSCHFGGPGDGIGGFWLTFVATDTSARISTCNSVVGDTLFAVYEDDLSGVACGNIGAGIVPEAGCSEDALCGITGLLSEACITTVPGRQYWIQVASFDEESLGAITVDVVCPCPAECETCFGDANGDGFLNGTDVGAFTDCVLDDPAGCPCTDANGDDVTNVDDVEDFVDVLLLGAGRCLNLCSPGLNGQRPATQAVLSNGTDNRLADNFTTSGGNLSLIEWWGVYGAGLCPDSDDDFTLTIYADGNGLPGATIATFPSIGVTREETIAAGLFRYSATIPATNLAAGCYWLEIVNADSAGGCQWGWSLSLDGDGVLGEDAEIDGYQGDDRIVGEPGGGNDMSWCLNIPVGNGPACSDQIGACCVNQVCIGETAEANCEGLWTADEVCAGFTCPEDSANCCDPHGGFGCQDQACENCVCGLDPFCCDTAWDAQCVGEARNDCTPPCNCPLDPPPANDSCATAIVVACPSNTLFDNSSATPIDAASAPDVNDPVPSCSFNGFPAQATMWFTFTGNGQTWTIQSCTTADVPDSIGDTTLSVWTGGCGPAMVQEACSEDDCAGGDTTEQVGGADWMSTVTVPTNNGQQYWIMWSSAFANRGEILMNISCTP